MKLYKHKLKASNVQAVQFTDIQQVQEFQKTLAPAYIGVRGDKRDKRPSVMIRHLELPLQYAYLGDYIIADGLNGFYTIARNEFEQNFEEDV